MNRSLSAKVSEFVRLTQAIRSFENLHRQGFPRLARAALNPAAYGHELLETPGCPVSVTTTSQPSSSSQSQSQSHPVPDSESSIGMLQSVPAIPTGQTGKISNVRRGDRLVLQKRAMAIPAEAVALKLKNRFRTRL